MERLALFIFIESMWRNLAQNMALEFLEPPVSEKSFGTVVYIMAFVHCSLSRWLRRISLVKPYDHLCFTSNLRAWFSHPCRQKWTVTWAIHYRFVFSAKLYVRLFFHCSANPKQQGLWLCSLPPIFCLTFGHGVMVAFQTIRLLKARHRAMKSIKR